MKELDVRMFRDLPEEQMEVLGTFYKEHRPRFVNWLSHKYNFSTKDAQDIFTDAMLIMYEKIKSGKLSLEKMSASLETFIFSVGRNLGNDRNRSVDRHNAIHQRIAEREPCSYDPSMSRDEKEEFALRWRVIEKELSRLPEKQQRMLHMFYYEGKSHEEIAQALGYKNAESAKRVKHSCIEKLRNRVNRG